jgi:S-(hydroxymethyl)mycothiol dehydrogenase
MLASGICHSDLHAKDGNFGREFPYLLGHEATGVVDAVGPGVDTPAVGTMDMLNWRAPCGRCRACAAGNLTQCSRPVTAGKRLHTADGVALGRVLGLGTFATHTVVAAGQAIPVAPDLAPEATCLIGCGVVTGVGAALFAAKVRAGSTVAVFGCGAVGISVVQAARIARARTIIAVDVVPRKLEWARQFGATHAIDSRAGDPIAKIKALTGGGADYAFEAVGLPLTLEQAVASTGLGGDCTLIGVPAPTAKITLSMAKFFYARATLRATFYGDCLASRDFPLMADWYRDGTLDLDGLVSARVGLGDVDEAFAAMQRGETLRSVIVFPD